MPIFKVERDGQIFNMESPSLETAMQDLQAYEQQSGGLQQAAQPGVGTEPEQPASEGRWAPNPLTMAYNLPSDLGAVGSEMAQAIAHPIDTAKGVYNMGWDGFKDMVYSQYGTWDNFVNYMENHPAHFGMDASMIGGPAAAGIKATGMAGKAGMLGKAASMAEKGASYAAKLDPFALAVERGAKMAKTGGNIIAGGLGATTGAGESIGVAAEAGYKGALSSPTAGKALDKVGLGAAKGGDEGKAFRGYQTRKADPDATVERAKEAVKDKRLEASIEHASDLAPILSDTSKLDFKHVEDSVMDIAKKHEVKPTGTTGKIIKERRAPGKEVQEVLETINYYKKGGIDIRGKRVKILNKAGKPTGKTRKMEWTDLKDATDTWTMNTFHQMRKEVGKIWRDIDYTNPARAEVGKIYYSMRDAVDKAYLAKHPGDPKNYGKVLSDYHKAMDEADELVKTFSLGDGPAKDTALRKLHSIMRIDTTHGNFGSRAKLAQALVDNGHKNLMYEIAGMHTAPYMKNTLHALTGGSIGTTAVTAGLSPHLLGALVAFSPRIIGWSAYRSGQVAGTIIKPALAIERALRRKLNRPLAKKFGRAGAAKIQHGAKKGLQYGSAQTGKMAGVGENKEELRANLLAEAQKRGVQIHERVLNNLADQIMSDDPERYLQGVRNVGRNPRLLKLFMDMGTKGEQ